MGEFETHARYRNSRRLMSSLLFSHPFNHFKMTPMNVLNSREKERKKLMFVPAVIIQTLLDINAPSLISPSKQRYRLVLLDSVLVILWVFMTDHSSVGLLEFEREVRSGMRCRPLLF